MMQVRLVLFAHLRDLAGRPLLELLLSKGASCEEALGRFQSLFGVSDELLDCCLVAVNGTYAEKHLPLSDGDEVALLPPVSGG